uniref:Uncharacterized protein n=1 Tax=Anguilla anguilla TaxID=7936 RepID=A0A0E9QWP1_ANGAN
MVSFKGKENMYPVWTHVWDWPDYIIFCEKCLNVWGNCDCLFLS